MTERGKRGMTSMNKGQITGAMESIARGKYRESMVAVLQLGWTKTAEEYNAAEVDKCMQ